MEPSGKLSNAAFPIEQSQYYQFWLLEREEIAKHKWVLSERSGHDVGWNYAQWDWHMRGYRTAWIKHLKSLGIQTY